MIVHVFTAQRYHLVPNIAKGFATKYLDDADHFFVFNGNSSLDAGKYHTLCSEIHFRNYCITRTKKELAVVLWKNRNNRILFHAGKYQVFLIALLVGCKNLEWICWGGDASIPKSNVSFISTPLRRFLYKRFNSIVTLMDQDRVSIIHDYHVNPKNIKTIPYASSGPQTKYDAFYDQNLQLPVPQKEKIMVILGNSPHNIKYYIDMLPYLAPYAKKIEVHCMNNYSLIKNENYYRLLELGEKLFGDNFQSNEDFYSYDDYIKYMNSCDIYICSNDEQTGLGAIGVCLQLGKKIFIHGKNLKWIQNNYDAVVFDTNVIKNGLNWDIFSKGLTNEEKRKNLLSVRKKRINAYESWKEYLRRY